MIKTRERAQQVKALAKSDGLCFISVIYMVEGETQFLEVGLGL